VSKEELALGETAIGERLPYNDYTTIDWLHDMVRILFYIGSFGIPRLTRRKIKDSYRFRALKSKKGFQNRTWAAWDACQGWIAAAIIGIFTAVVAFVVGT
jgi:chloride channel 3/4/5